MNHKEQQMIQAALKNMTPTLLAPVFVDALDNLPAGEFIDLPNTVAAEDRLKFVCFCPKDVSPRPSALNTWGDFPVTHSVWMIMPWREMSRPLWHGQIIAALRKEGIDVLTRVGCEPQFLQEVFDRQQRARLSACVTTPPLASKPPHKL